MGDRANGFEQKSWDSAPGYRSGGRALVEDDGAVFVGQQTMVKVSVDGTGEDDFFQVAAEADEVVHALSVGNADDVLFDNGAFVEFFGDVVGGGADDFDASVVGGLVGACSGEGGKKRVVNVDDAHGERLYEGGAENLHVPGEDDKIDVGVFQEGDLARLGFGFVGRGDGDAVKGESVALGEFAVVFVVGEDEGDIDGPFAAFVAGEDIVEAMGLFGDEHGHAQVLAGQV